MNTLTNLQRALEYRQLGWSVIPVGVDKRPLVDSWAEFQNRTPSEDEVVAWWTRLPTAGIAVITGSISGIVVLDIDAKHGRSPSELPPIPVTVCSKTGGGGWHYFFKHTGGRVKSTNGQLFGPGIDIKADGGYVILAPSVHASGKKYEWTIGPGGENIANIPDWLQKALEGFAPIKSSAGVADILEGVDEGTRNDSAARMSGKLLQSFRSDEWETIAWPLLRSWNQSTCKPPLSEHELRGVFDSISKKHLSAPGNNSPSAVVGTQDAALGKSLPMSELYEMNLPPVQWVIEHLMNQGSINMLSAAPNQRKSFLALHIAICLATGDPVFEHFKVEKQATLIVNEEDPLNDIHSRLHLLAPKGNLPIHFYIQREITLSEECVTQVIAEAKRLGATFVIFDSLRSVHALEENSSKEMQIVMNQLKRFMREGMTVLFTHHNRKKFKGFGASSDDGSGEEARGSTSINAAVHSHHSLEPLEDNGVTKIIVRQQKLKCDKKLAPFVVRVEEQISSIRFVYEGTHAAAGSVSQTKASIIPILKKHGGWMSTKEICEAGQTGKRNTEDALRDLVTEGHAEKRSRRALEKDGKIQPGDGAHNTSFYRFRDKEHDDAVNQQFDDF